MQTPRNLGYAIGDRIEHRVRLVLENPYRLDESKLAKPGRINNWLELQAIDVSSRRRWSSRAYDITIRYQLFNTTPKVHGLATPPQTLTVVAPKEAYPLIVPAWSFDAVPVINREERAEGAPPTLRPARAPPPYATTLRAYRIAALAALFAAVLGVWLYLQFGLPFINARKRPFARAYRTLGGLSPPLDHASYTQALRVVHKALDQTAGQTLLARDLERFVAERPRFALQRARLEHFFDESRRVFFEDPAPSDARDKGSLHGLRELCRACRGIERNHQ